MTPPPRRRRDAAATTPAQRRDAAPAPRRRRDRPRYDDASLPSRTNQTALASIAYIDKHPQPSPDAVLETLLRDGYGSWNASALAAKVPAATASGDVHVAAYGFGPAGPTELLVAKGENDADGGFAVKACDAPFARWDLGALWAREKPRV